MKRLVVAPDEAAGFLVFLLGWNGGSLPVFVDGGAVPSSSVGLGPGSDAGVRLWGRAHGLDEVSNAQVEVGLPRARGSVVESTVLWCYVRGPEQLARAARFRPCPAMVLRFGGGSDRLLLWGLREVVPWANVAPSNERIAYRLGAARSRCAPDDLRVPVPGTFLRVGRRRPLPVVLTRMVVTDYTRSQVVAGLRDPPSRGAWRDRR